MARKGPQGKSSSARPSVPSKAAGASTSVPRWRTAEDVPMDEVDAFQASRDRILLDERAEQDDEEEEFGDGMNVLDVDVEDEDEDEDDGEEEGEEDEGAYDEEEEEESFVPQAHTGRAARMQSQAEAEAEESDVSSEASLQEETGWGPHKAAYYDVSRPNADDSDSELDPEEARELQLKEAKSLQLKARAALQDEDFGVGEQDWQSLKGASGLLGMNKAARQKRREELDGGTSLV